MMWQNCHEAESRGNSATKIYLWLTVYVSHTCKEE